MTSAIGDPRCGVEIVVRDVTGESSCFPLTGESTYRLSSPPIL
jgi:hypothetical protein